MAAKGAYFRLVERTTGAGAESVEGDPETLESKMADHGAMLASAAESEDEDEKIAEASLPPMPESGVQQLDGTQLDIEYLI